MNYPRAFLNMVKYKSSFKMIFARCIFSNGVYPYGKINGMDRAKSQHVGNEQGIRKLRSTRLDRLNIYTKILPAEENQICRIAMGRAGPVLLPSSFWQLGRPDALHTHVKRGTGEALTPCCAHSWWRWEAGPRHWGGGGGRYFPRQPGVCVSLRRFMKTQIFREREGEGEGVGWWAGDENQTAHHLGALTVDKLF